jgi:glucose/mannose-6-phosphate isomerase
MTMTELIDGFPAQVKKALEIGRAATLTKSTVGIQNILISGLGGSGIGGTIAAELVASKCTLPITVNKEYFIPAFVGENTLVIISSYSGNTEETLQALDLAYNKGAKIVCVTSGGKIAAFAKEKGIDLIEIPGGMPPRSCLGYSLTQLFFVLAFNGFIDNYFEAELANAVSLLENQSDSIREKAMAIARQLNGKQPVIYATPGYEGVAVRFRQQLNENSKILCWHHVIPEMNHNELVGWRDVNDGMAAIFLRNKEEYFRNTHRIEYSREVITRCTGTIIDIWAEGTSDIEKAMYLVHLTDYISDYLAALRNHDAVEVNIITGLKGMLEDVKN